MTFITASKAGVASIAQGFAKPFPSKAGVAGQLHHAARPGNVASGFGEQGCVFRCLVHAGLKVLRAVFVRLQVVGCFKGLNATLCGGGGVHEMTPSTM